MRLPGFDSGYGIACGTISPVFRHRLQSLVLALALSALPLAASAQAKGQLPYATVNSYLELFRSLEHLDLITPSMMVYSTNPRVSPQSIELKVMTDDGWQNFRPDENGIVSLPEKPDWADHNLITNQPKGTLQLVIGFTAKPLNSPSISYQELMGLVPQFDEALAALASQQGQPACIEHSCPNSLVCLYPRHPRMRQVALLWGRCCVHFWWRALRSIVTMMVHCDTGCFCFGATAVCTSDGAFFDPSLKSPFCNSTSSLAMTVPSGNSPVRW